MARKSVMDAVPEHKWKHHGHHLHRKDDRAWPYPDAEMYILRLHKSKQQYLTRLKQSDPARGLLVVKSAAVDGKNVAAKVGDRMLLAWIDNEGEHVMPVALVKIVEEEIPMWVTVKTGVAITKQIRQFVRQRDIAQVEVVLGTHHIEGIRLDISEGGMKCSVSSQERVVEGDKVSVKTRVDKHEIHADAQVMRVIVKEGKSELGLKFAELPPKDEDAIRQHVYKLQVRERKMKTGSD